MCCAPPSERPSVSHDSSMCVCISFVSLRMNIHSCIVDIWTVMIVTLVACATDGTALYSLWWLRMRHMRTWWKRQRMVKASFRTWRKRYPAFWKKLRPSARVEKKGELPCWKGKKDTLRMTQLADSRCFQTKQNSGLVDRDYSLGSSPLNYTSSRAYFPFVSARPVGTLKWHELL